jgi:hypothetical protein
MIRMIRVVRLSWPATTLACLMAARAAAGAPSDAKCASADEAAELYRWSRRAKTYDCLARRFPPPTGHARVQTPKGSYAEWLRHLPLLPPGTPVLSYRRSVILPSTNPALAAVVDLDVGTRDRQQCVDTIMRLRGEYLFSRGTPDSARFLWAGGKRFGYSEWRQGIRPVRQARTWLFERRTSPTEGYRSYRWYLDYMFSWTGTIHQTGEPRVRSEEIRGGDFFVQGGSPGHAVVVLDLARSEAGSLKALLAQGYMPAQDLHLLRSSRDSAWFSLEPPAPVSTPLWGRPFQWAELRRFRY